MLRPNLALFILTAGLPTRAAAETLNVSDVNGLLAAIADAAAGDDIVLSDGVYTLDANVNCSAAGLENMPIVVRAENPLGAIVQFDAVEGFKVNAPNWHFEGLDVRGACGTDSDCEHAFHVVGQADGFVLRDSRVADFNAQLKVNAQEVDGVHHAPNAGLVENSDLGDTRARQTDAPVTKLNIDGGSGWIVRGNYIHDFHKDGGNGISYGAFMKSGGDSGLFERNLVSCDAGASSGGARIGLSFGGGGTAPEFCAPAYDADVPCDPEHSDGEMRNNIIVSCSDVGIYLNQALNTRLYYNTLVSTGGVDFRFQSSSGLTDGNVISGPIRDRDGANHTEGVNLLEVVQESYDSWYTDPMNGDLSLAGDAPGELSGRGEARVTDDYCGRKRPNSKLTLGALEHTLGDCDTFPPPRSDGTGGEGGEGAPGGTGGGRGSTPSAGGEGTAAESTSAASSTGGTRGAIGGTRSASSTSSGDGGAGTMTGTNTDPDGGCGCRLHGAASPPATSWLFLLGLSWCRRRGRTMATDE